MEETTCPLTGGKAIEIFQKILEMIVDIFLKIYL